MLNSGAAFEATGERIRCTRGPISGRCKCACGWLSDVLPNAPARWYAYRDHQEQAYVDEERHVSANRRRRRGATIFEKCGSKPREVIAERFWKFVDRPDEEPDTCWTWSGTQAWTGYGNFDGHGAHRVSYWLAAGEEPGTLHVLHRCDNRPCVRPSHLFLGTHQDNMADMRAKGRAAKNTTISDSQVQELRRRYLAGESSTDLSVAFGISRAQVGRIVTGESRGVAEAPQWKQRGLRNPRAKLTDDQVRKIRATYAAGGVTQRALAATYGIDQGYLSALINHKERKDVA
jgi:hypothetical protein